MATVVKITKHQTTALLQELGGHSDVLAESLADRELVGSEDTLRAIARRLDAVAGAAEAKGEEQRARRLRSVLSRMSEAGIDAVEQIERRGVALSEVPQVKRLHPSRRRRYDRRAEALSEGDLDQADAGFDVELLRKGRAAGRDASKAAFSSKAKGRAGKERGMIRGDRLFWHNEPYGEVRGAEGAMRVTPNDERSAWLLAGNDGKSRFRDATRAGQLARAKASSKDDLDVRIDRASWVVAKRNDGRVRPSLIAYELEREDLKAKRYPLRGARHKAAHAKYLKAAQSFCESLVPVEVIETASEATQRAAARRGPLYVAARVECNHEWRVSPKRTRRTCEACGRVERKVRGRWQLVVAKPKKVERTPEQDEAVIRRFMSILHVSREEAEAKLESLAQFA